MKLISWNVNGLRAVMNKGFNDFFESMVEVEKKNIKTTDRPYWECADGSVITAGSVVVAQNPGGEDHVWIYMGEFDSRNDVISYLKSIGVLNARL